MSHSTLSESDIANELIDLQLSIVCDHVNLRSHQGAAPTLIKLPEFPKELAMLVLFTITFYVSHLATSACLFLQHSYYSLQFSIFST